MSSSEVTLESFLIPLKEIDLATRNFSPETRIGNGGFGVVYKGQLSERWRNRTAAFKHLYPDSYKRKNDFRNEVEMISSFNHENIIPFIGYCHEGNNMIIASEYAINESLEHHLQDPNKRGCLTWAQRLKICIGAARGLQYLHSGLGEGRTVIHRNIKGANILLDGNLEAKISVSGGPITQHRSIMTTFDAGAFVYMDPNYNESGILNKESDVYSLGVVLFEVLSGMLAHYTRSIDGQEPQTLKNLVRIYYDNALDKLIDPLIRTQIDDRSFRTFKQIACRCITFTSKDRPKMDEIIQSIEEALDFQINHGAASTSAIQINQFQNLERFLVPLNEIKIATQGFSLETRIGVGGYGAVYRGQIPERWQNVTASFDRMDPSIGERKFRNEVEMMSSFNHENVITFLGYCDEENERIIVSEHVFNISLDLLLENAYKIKCITWSQRLKICIGAARGLNYLHSGLGEHNVVIHRDVKSANILLDVNVDAKICGFVLSILVDRNKPQGYEHAAGTPYYLDPIYNESGIVKTELDIYSFGVVLFEMLSGMLAYNNRSIGDDEPQTLINLVRRYYDKGLEKLIDPHIKDHINIHSFHAFKEIAYRCISLNLKDRPTMKRVIKKLEQALHIQNHGASSSITTTSQQCQNLESFLIPLREIKLATQDFSAETRIGDGGFGVVYKGQLSERWQNCTVAIKRLDSEGHQGRNEFLTELKLISSFHHKNIIPFIGYCYCDEDNEMIIVSEYASNRSLDHHLQDPNKRCSLTWSQRLKICLGAARGLNYLHTGLGEDNRVIHRDIKSANILLDENLEAKVCDFGLAKQGPRNQQPTHLYTKVAGTNFYVDPIYQESGILCKESDVYSFGVVLFEILSGMLAFHCRSLGNDKPQPLINLIRRYYHDGLEELVDPLIKDQIDRRCFQTFKELAYRCISYNSKERPTMETIIERIEDAMDFQKSMNKA